MRRQIPNLLLYIGTGLSALILAFWISSVFIGKAFSQNAPAIDGQPQAPAPVNPPSPPSPAVPANALPEAPVPQAAQRGEVPQVGTQVLTVLPNGERAGKVLPPPSAEN